MRKRFQRSYQSRSYRSYPRPGYRNQREDEEYLASINRFLTKLLTCILLMILAVALAFLLTVLLTHLAQITAISSQVISLMTIYGPIALLLISIVAGSFIVLGVIYGIVKVLAAISETLSYASLAHTKVKQERAKIHRYRQVRPLPKLRSSARRHIVDW
jgi:type III secretory pathway component EscU